MTHEDILGRLLAELPRAIGTMFETSASKRPATAPVRDGFSVTIQGTGDARGDVRLVFEREGAAAIAKAASDSALEPNDTVIGERLKDLCAQVAGAVTMPFGAALIVASVAVAREIPPAASGAAIEIVIKGVEQVLRVTAAGTLDVAVHVDDTPVRGGSQTLDVIMDIDLPLVVRFGRTELPLRILTTLGPGSVIDLGRAPDDPVEVLISNRVIARGEVVIVAGSYGVRVHDVISPAERARSLEAEFV